MAKKSKKDNKSKGKHCIVELAPAIYRLLAAEKEARNAAQDDHVTLKVTYAEILNEALERYLPNLLEKQGGSEAKTKRQV